MTGRLNVLVITSHDVGRRLGCYGVAGVPTPSLDAMAAEGVAFDACFATSSICSPARASIFTGRYPHEVGVLGLTHLGWDMDDPSRHLAHALRGAGYDTAAFGIHHESQRPTDAGYAVHDRVGAAEPLADAFAAWLGERGDDRPWFAHVGFFEPHRTPGGHGWGPYEPLDPASRTVPRFLKDEPSARVDVAAMDAAIAALDRGVGRVLAAVDRAGVAGRTVVVFTADHGLPFARAKGGCYDPGLEVALLVRGPGVEAGGRRLGLVSHVDVAPTLLELAGLDAAGRSGVSLASWLKAERPAARDAVYAEMNFHAYADPIRCVRTDRHKLIVNFTNAPAVFDSSQRWRPPARPATHDDPRAPKHPPLELYELDADPLEANNLADDPACAETRRGLLARLHAWMRETQDPLLRGFLAPPHYHEAVALLTASEEGR